MIIQVNNALCFQAVLDEAFTKLINCLKKKKYEADCNSFMNSLLNIEMCIV